MPEYVMTENGNIKVKDGKPLVKDGDSEYTVDAIGAQTKITELNSEAAKYRKKASERKTELAKFDGIDDPAAALDAVKTVASLGDDHKADLDALKTSMKSGYETKLGDKDQEIADLKTKLFGATVTSKFATSEVIKKTVLTPDIAATFFGKHFKADGTATDAAGNTIYAKERPGEPAEFDEALTTIIDQYPGKASIMKATDGGGGGNPGPGNPGGGDLSSHDNIKAGLAARQ